MVKNSPVMQETQVQSSGQEDPLEKGLTLPVLLDSEGSISTSVGVVDHGIEGLVDPLPEKHCWSGPEIERSVTHPPPPGI